jgi:type I restriction enzyme M protein
MHEKDLAKRLGFSPKESKSCIYNKKYTAGYTIEIDFNAGTINYGKEIKSDSKTTQNFSQAENFVVLECVDRLLLKGYKPKDITLEKIFPSGHGHSGRLDILVKNGKKTFLMIECKTWGKEFDKESANIQKNGGQLFTYFQNDTNADYLMLYTSHFPEKAIEYKYEIIKIEDTYRSAGNVEDVYNRWNKITNKNGIFESWVEPYKFQNKLLTKRDLQRLTEEDSGKIFNSFASILRKHSVSDKPNAFNKIFNLFLAKIYDEKKKDTEDLDFQWKEKLDNPVDFHIRLINLHKAGLFEFLRKEIVGISEKDFEGAASEEEFYQKKKDRLKFDKLFDIKEVFDDDSFEDNFKVLKEVVQLLERYQIRYPRRQQHLSDFFERLLTTGLKQEAGQYFTPVPIARFIVRSLPVKEMIENALNSTSETLPAVIDYAAGSGHFITEILETYQDIIDNLDTSNYYPAATKKVKAWQNDQYSWAAHYIYGIEKDYRLVKVAKVGCYFYGDGLAQVFHADGLDSFSQSKIYKGLLKDNAGAPQFDIVISNPPYSVDTFKGDLRNKNPDKDFTLYKNLTDRSSEIECLFVERAAQLLKENGLAGIILPVSMLSNAGIYTKTREIILEKFEIAAIAQFGSKTFMETNTTTAVFFLIRRNDEKVQKIKKAAYVLAESYPETKKDLTIGGLENPVEKYLAHTGAAEIDAEKLYYFILAFNQTVVVVKTGEKDAEKRFLGYEFSNRRGNEGIHPIARGRRIEDCTRLFDDTNADNPEKASAYIYRAFKGDVTSEIAENLKDNVFRFKLIDMIAFDRKDFEKTISLAVIKEAYSISCWNTNELVYLGKIAEIKKGTPITKSETAEGNIPVIAGGQDVAYYHNVSNRDGNIITISASGAYSGHVNYFAQPIFASDCNTVKSLDENKISTKLIYYLLKHIQRELYSLARGQAQPHVYAKDIANIQVPLPPKNIQEKIVAEIETIEKQENFAQSAIKDYRKKIEALCIDIYNKYNSRVRLSDLAVTNPVKNEISDIDNTTPVSFVEMASVSNDGYILSSVDRPYGDVKRGSYTYFKNDDIIIAKITPCMENGKCALAYNLTNGTGFGSSEFHVIRADKTKINIKYLFTLLNRDIVRTEAAKNMTGASGHRRVPAAFYERLEIPLPSLVEQNKMVSQVEKAEIRIYDLQKQLEQAPKQKELVLKKYL